LYVLAERVSHRVACPREHVLQAKRQQGSLRGGVLRPAQFISMDNLNLPTLLVRISHCTNVALPINISRSEEDHLQNQIACIQVKA